jgi:hypothetical protein
MTLSEIFTEARKAATTSTIRALRGFGYELEELEAVPKSELENAFEYGDEAAWKALNSLGALQHPEWTFDQDRSEKVDAPF